MEVLYVQPEIALLHVLLSRFQQVALQHLCSRRFPYQGAEALLPATC